MDSGWWGRLVLTIGIILISIFALLTTFVYRSDSNIPSWIPESLRGRISLGLDLQGGVHLVLGVKIEEAIADKITILVDSMKSEFKEAGGIGSVKVEHPEELSYGARLTFESEKDKELFQSEILNHYSQFQIASSNDLQLNIALNPDYSSFLKTNIFDQVVKTIGNRIDEFNVKEASIAKRGSNQILIELPGVENPDEAKKRFGTTARLEFKMVDDESDFIKSLKDKLPEGIKIDYYSYEGPNGNTVTEASLISNDRKKLIDFISNRELVPLPDDHEILLGNYTSHGEKWYRTYYLYKKVNLTGDYIADSQVSVDSMDNRPYVTLTFDNAGAKIFAKITGDNVKRRFAIILDKVVNSAPVIQERIGGGSARITLGGMKSYDALLTEANDLAAVLRAGALPAEVEVLFKREVGPMLGQDSINKGFTSSVVGLILVGLFMLIYYKFSGIVANLALVLNVLLILAIMAAFGATLTLPGIAGLVLTVGMAVDANVIINERIREEMRDGRSPRASVEVGYAKAFSAIFDSNLTTILASVILYQFGTGPIRGFAVTLSIGIASSMFTAIFVTRIIMDYITQGLRIKQLSI